MTNSKGYVRAQVYGFSFKILAQFEPQFIPLKNESFLFPTVLDVKMNFDYMQSEGWNTWMLDHTMNLIVESILHGVSF